MHTYAHFRVSRSIEDIDKISLTARTICQNRILQDCSNGILLPTFDDPSLHVLRGEDRYTIKKLALPIFEIVKPESHRKALYHAAARYDDHGHTAVAQVTEKIKQIDLAYDVVNQEKILLRAKNIETSFDLGGFVTLLVIESPDMFKEEHQTVVEFMEYMGRMRTYKKNDVNLQSEEPYRPRVPLISYALNVSEDEVLSVHSALSNELQRYEAGVRLLAGPVMPPKVY